MLGSNGRVYRLCRARFGSFAFAAAPRTSQQQAAPHASLLLASGRRGLRGLTLGPIVSAAEAERPSFRDVPRLCALRGLGWDVPAVESIWEQCQHPLPKREEGHRDRSLWPSCGARDWNRTSTSVRTHDPESCASTNSATRARRSKRFAASSANALLASTRGT